MKRENYSNLIKEVKELYMELAKHQKLLNKLFIGFGCLIFIFELSNILTALAELIKVIR